MLRELLCALHLPGNHQCPYPALYEVSWWDRADLSRRVCAFHLAPAIDRALDDSAKGAEVKVTLCR